MHCLGDIDFGLHLEVLQKELHRAAFRKAVN